MHSEDQIISISAGNLSTIVVTKHGRVFTWGRNEYGQLGDGTTTDRLVPVEITFRFSLDDGEYIVQVYAGGTHFLTLTSEGRVFAWGRNASGQLGNGTSTDSNIPVDITSRFNLASGEVISNLAAGTYHSLAYSSEGRVFGWGHEQYFQTGVGTGTYSITSPADVTANFSFNTGEYPVAISGAYYSSVLVTNEGRVFTWGLNYYGEIGNGSLSAAQTPLDITANFTFNTGETAVDCVASHTFTAILTSDGRVFTFGDNNYGQLGDGTTTDSLLPMDVTFGFTLYDGETIIYIDTGNSHGSGVTSEGRLSI